MRNAMMIGERVYLRAFETADAETLAQIAATETDTFMYRGRKPFSPLAYEHDIGEAYKTIPPGSPSSSLCGRTTAVSGWSAWPT